MTNSADPDQLASEISWLLKKPTDLDLHCLLRQGMSCSAREGLIDLFMNTGFVVVFQVSRTICMYS